MSIQTRSNQYGKVLGDWTIRERIGGGSCGATAVYRLSKRIGRLEQNCALKAVPIISEAGTYSLLSDSRRAQYQNAKEICLNKAIDEVQIMSQLKSKTNIVDYHDCCTVDWEDGEEFGCDLLIQMELLQSSLRREMWVNGRIFSEPEIIQIGIDICTALVLCHGKGIWHRDIKPGNILFNTDGDSKLGDFGISRILEMHADSYASTGNGTPQYKAPEQNSGRYDHRVDIYSLGLVLYELSNQNRLPFATSPYVQEEEVQRRLNGDSFEAPSDASSAFAEVIMKSCAHNPADRYQSAQEMLDALKELSRADQEEDYDTCPADSEVEEEIPDIAIIAAADAMYKSGLDFETGNGVEQDYIEAISCYEEAAKRGKIEAMYKLGYIYEMGLGVSKDLDKALDYYRAGIIGNDETAARRYHSILTGLTNVDLTRLEAKGHSLANIARYMPSVVISEPPLPPAPPSVDLPSGEQEYQLAQKYCHYFGLHHSQNYANAAEWYEKAVEKGHPESMFELAVLYENGLGVEQDLSEAIKLYQKSAEKENANAMYALGLCFETGTGVQQSYDRAFSWYQKAAAKHHADALYALGIFYENGLFVVKDYAIAAIYYKSAAEKGHPYAICNLGVCYENETKYSEAAACYEEAVDRGVVEGMVNLGYLYEMGRGVKKDLTKALDYYLMAMKENDETATERYTMLLGSLSRRNLKRLAAVGHSPANLEEAHTAEFEKRRKARAWRIIGAATLEILALSAYLIFPSYDTHGAFGTIVVLGMMCFGMTAGTLLHKARNRPKSSLFIYQLLGVLIAYGPVLILLILL